MKLFTKAALLFVVLLLNVQSNAQEAGNETPNDSIVPQSGKTIINQAQLRAIPFRNSGSAVLTSPNVYHLKGEDYYFDGLQAGNDYMFIDGMQVKDGKDFLYRGIENYTYYRFNQPVYLGNTSGGMVEIQTSSYTDSLHVEGEVFFAPEKEYQNLFYELLLGGPISFKKKENRAWKHRPSFLISASFNGTNDPDPSSEDKYRINPEIQSSLDQFPLRPTDLASGGTYLNSEFTRQNNFYRVGVHQNAERKTQNIFAKLQIPINNKMELTLGSYYRNDVGKEFVFNNALFNLANNPNAISRNIDNYLNWKHTFINTKNVQADYIINFQYSNYYFQRQNETFKDDWFKYGYLGKYTTHKMATYELGDEVIDGVEYQNVWKLNSWDFDTAYTFQGMGFNPVAARFTEMVYELYPDKFGDFFNGGNGNWMNPDQLQMNGGLLNGQSPNSAYGLWSGQGDVSVPAFANQYFYATLPYGENRQEHYRSTFQINLQYKKHHFKTGFEYSKKIERSYQIAPNKLWRVMRGVANFHILTLDVNNPIPIYHDGVFMDTIIYNRKYDAASQFTFDKNLRRKLGLNEDGLDFILTDSYDMKNNTIQYYDKDGNLFTISTPENLYSFDMFNLGMLIENGIVNYNGYNYDGSKSKTNNDYYRFYKDGTTNPYMPIYSSFYLEDEFQYGNFSARIGLKLDYYNANQPVMKDKYSLYETYHKADVHDFGGIPVTHPSNIGDDYVVYVDNPYCPTFVTGYRDEDTWYNANGNEIIDPGDLDAGSGVNPYLKYPGVHIGDGEWEPDMSFESYKPVYGFLPQINLNYKFWRMNAYANYNSFSKNPSFLNVFRPEDYWMTGLVQFQENPSLKPYRIDKINLGANIQIYKGVYSDVSIQEMIVSDYFGIYHLTGAYPYEYTTLLNLSGNIKVSSITAAFQYVPQKQTGWSGNVSATKSFIDERDRAYLNISDFVLNGHLGYNFGFGPDFVFRGNKILTTVFEGFNMGLFYQNRTGTLLSKPRDTNYNYKYTPNFSFFNLRVEKGFYFKKTGLYISAYVWVENLFNKQNFYYVDPLTGKPNDDGYLNDPSWQQSIENTTDPDSFRQLYQMKLNNPAYYAKPRIWRVGIIVKF